VITVQDLELRAGARLLMDQVSFRIDKGDKIGLVGRNGAGKTTLTRVLAGEGLPAAGKVTRTGEIGYLPQDPRTPDMEQLARDRILSVRGLDIAVGKLRLAHEEMASEDAAVQGGLIVISHDTELLEATVNKVFLLDANRAQIDFYNMDWKRYLTQRETDERARKRERANAEKKAQVLFDQANKMRAKATKAVAAQNMAKRAERLLSGLEAVREQDRVAALRFPDPSPCGRTPLTAEGLSKSYGSLEIFTDVDLAIDRGSKVVILGLNGAGKTTLLRMLAGVDKPDTGDVIAGHGLKVGYYAQEHETLDVERTVLENMRSAAPDMKDAEVRGILGSFLFSGDDVDKPAGVLSGGEKTRLALATIVASSANVLLLDEPTNNLDPASRAEILGALKNYSGAVVLVSHDEGAVEALNPERVVLLPDGVEDHWNEDYLDLITLA
jgi:ATPase subunit of ABC transporter with duplicated ATPase domains